LQCHGDILHGVAPDGIFEIKGLQPAAMDFDVFVVRAADFQ